MWSVLRALGCVSSLVPSIMALNVPRPNHAVAELLVAPNNLIIMTPRDTSSLLDRQLLDFGTPFSSGFSGLRHLAARQGCNAATEVCQNDPTTCCQVGGDCCGGGICCKAGSFCYGGGCCPSTKIGCNGGCCDRDANCCTKGGCCASGSRCVTINGKVGCCPIGQTCTSEPECSRTGYSPCANESFCCPTGFMCARDLANEPLCVDPNAQTTTSIPPPHFSTRPAVSSIATHVQTTKTAQTPQATGPGAIFAQAKSSANAGAIAGGTVAGVVALALLAVVFIIWRRKQLNGAANSEIPINGTASSPSSKDAYSPNGVPPTPGTVDPFLTPMTQHPNPGVSYFATPLDNPTSDTGSSPQYTGLPEPQYGDDTGVAVGTPTMPGSRHDLHHPHPLPMSVTPLRKSTADSGPARVWSGFISNPSTPSGQNAVHSGGNTPTPSGWSNPEGTNTNSAYSGTPSASNAYGSTPPLRASSTVYPPPEGGEHSGNRDLYPPASPPPESLYPRAFAGNLGGLPSGAAPPRDQFHSVEK
ncbi:transmembrane protein, putative [Rhizoctonia solani AG-3 Rhs1AP]|uniref:Transmembrane protein, putative n=1 Tax=Rhizoctonia solani AG-3 Rhs1AP TaxID=1086054 RepID=A0A0A1UIC0_9AGAM|nr:transmembrane protein, putative [Rhizoctonia solani AG-3 Rhs1AP]